ncbi:hypothetical protein V1264_017020 [Littorina saxatilis]|uniref:Uncharacterized protein n=2 Tax=Littorina saxatilis TaxID=31220 RepID=A0AAN9BGC9_9CAEN
MASNSEQGLSEVKIEIDVAEEILPSLLFLTEQKALLGKRQRHSKDQDTTELEPAIKQSLGSNVQAPTGPSINTPKVILIKQEPITADGTNVIVKDEPITELETSPVFREKPFTESRTCHVIKREPVSEIESETDAVSLLGPVTDSRGTAHFKLEPIAELETDAVIEHEPTMNLVTDTKIGLEHVRDIDVVVEHEPITCEVHMKLGSVLPNETNAGKREVFTHTKAHVDEHRNCSVATGQGSFLGPKQEPVSDLYNIKQEASTESEDSLTKKGEASKQSQRKTEGASTKEKTKSQNKEAPRTEKAPPKRKKGQQSGNGKGVQKKVSTATSLQAKQRPQNARPKAHGAEQPSTSACRSTEHPPETRTRSLESSRAALIAATLSHSGISSSLKMIILMCLIEDDTDLIMVVLSYALVILARTESDSSDSDSDSSDSEDDMLAVMALAAMC